LMNIGSLQFAVRNLSTLDVEAELSVLDALML
jgi:hypothetical protein